MKIARALLVMLLIFFSCETPLGPNELGGNSDLELTGEGNEFGISLSGDVPGLSNIKDSVVITKNDKGIITVFTRLAIDERSLKAIDSSLGLNVLTTPLKQQIIDYYKNKFGLVIDTTNKDSMYA
jgi:hypothetical protein